MFYSLAFPSFCGLLSVGIHSLPLSYFFIDVLNFPLSDLCTYSDRTQLSVSTYLTSSHHPIYPLTDEGRWGTTDDFATSFLHFPLFSTALWDLANSRPVHSLMLSSTSSSVCLVFFPPLLYLARWFWPDLLNGRHAHTTAVCVSLRWSGDLRVVRLLAGSWHGRPRL